MSPSFESYGDAGRIPRVREAPTMVNRSGEYYSGTRSLLAS